MDVLGAVSLIQTLYSLVKAIYRAKEKVARYKQEVDEFVDSIAQIERHLKHQESILRQHLDGLLDLPVQVSILLIKLKTLLESSRQLLEKSQSLSYLSLLTNFPDRLKDLRDDIYRVKIDMAFEMLFVQKSPSLQLIRLQQSVSLPAHTEVQAGNSPHKSLSLPNFVDASSSRTSGLWPVENPTTLYLSYPGYPSGSDNDLSPATSSPQVNMTPSFVETSASFYPPEDAFTGWKSYRDEILVGLPHPIYINLERNHFHPSPTFISQYPGDTVYQDWLVYQEQFFS